MSESSDIICFKQNETIVKRPFDNWFLENEPKTYDICKKTHLN